MTYCRVITDPIDTVDLLDRVRCDRDGAVLLFTGVVRDHNDGRRVTGLGYEAYVEMATGVLRRIVEEVGDRYEVGEIAVVHRIGELEIGEASVAIAVAAPHRDAAYRASRDVIERLKQEAPIWKHEHYADGDEAWVEGTIPEVGRSD